MSGTLLEAVQASLLAASRHAPGEVAPAAILWPDADGQWMPLVEQLSAVMPQLLILGTFDPERRTGPAIWMRCVIERALAEVSLPDRAVPVVYMPRVSRQALRAVEECPETLRPLVELQYRGAVWCQHNGKDWTVEAFLVSEDSGLALDVAKDNSTRRSLMGALAHLATTPLSRLRGKRLEAEDFDKLMVEDTPRNLLEWMSDPKAIRERWDDSHWSAFRSRCKAQYSFDPETDGELVAGERLGAREVEWFGVWERFVESPALYPGLPDLLRRAKPSGLFIIKETWPDENELAEKALRKSLVSVGKCDAATARGMILTLEKDHGMRRGWVWTKLGQSTLALALKHLAALAAHTVSGVGGDTPAAMADAWTHGGYLADDAVLRAVAITKTADDFEAVCGAVRAMYLPWLSDAAEHLQKLVAAAPLPGNQDKAWEPIEAEPGTCLLFVDGLRFDVAQRLAGLAQDRKLRVVRNSRWAAAPTVTGTAKPAVTPAAGQLTGNQLGEAFVPDVAATGQALTHDKLVKLVEAAGYQWLPKSEVGKPLDPNARAWTEYGEFDKLGHDLQAKLAARIDDQVELVIERIDALLSAGWREVRVVTDHGWLLVPGGLPVVTLPKYLTQSRWSRCATLKAAAQVSVPTARWHWNAAEVFAFGAGVHCFGAGNQYAHGGISLQECVIPDLTFSQDTGTSEVAATIDDLQWLGLRCRVTVVPAGVSLTADVRTKVGDAASSIVAPKPVDKDGKVGLLVENESLEPASLSERAKIVVLLRMVPFVERNYNLVELGPRGTGKSHLFQQISPYSHLISGGKATVAKMFVNNASGQRGLVCHYDVVCFDEVAGISFDQKDGVNIMKGYMASGEFSRGKESIRASGSIVMVGNLDVDPQQQQRISHLLSPLPPEMRNDTAFMDRLHSYIPGWDFPKLNPHEQLTIHFGLVSDFLSECWTKLREGSRVSVFQGRVNWGGALSGRDIEAVTRTVSGLTKLLFPDPAMPVPEDELEKMIRLALESRRRVKEQQKRVLKTEFRNTHFSYFMGVEGVEQFVSTPELHSEDRIETDPLPPGQTWAISPGGQDAAPGLYRIEATVGPGGGVRILNAPVPPAFRESVRFGEQNLYTRAKDLVGGRDPRAHEFSVQLRAIDADRSGGGLGLAVLLALCGGLLERSIKGGLIVVGALNLEHFST